jgi:hypothetical protein
VTVATWVIVVGGSVGSSRDKRGTMAQTRKTKDAGKAPSGPVFHVCILGPAGVGKSSLAALFKLDGFDPLRVRTPRDQSDAFVCVLEEDASELYPDGATDAPPWPSPVAPDGWFVVGDNWLFMEVRGDRQCLRILEEDGTPSLRAPRRIEVFAPRLVDILNDKGGAGTKADFRAENLVVLLLNPTSESYDAMDGKPTDDLRQATFYSVTKRTELRDKAVDLPDTQKRVRLLHEELAAWTQIKALVGDCCIEYIEWNHAEFRYHQPVSDAKAATRELRLARETVIKGLREAPPSPAVTWLLTSGVIRTPAEITKLLEDIA